MRRERTDSTVSLSPQITHQGNHTEKTGERKGNGKELPGAVSAASGQSPAPRTPAPAGPQPKTQASLGPPRPTPRSGLCACARAGLPVRAPRPPPSCPVPGNRLVLRLTHSILGPALPRPILRVGRASAWPRSLAPPHRVDACRREYCVTPAQRRGFQSVCGRICFFSKYTEKSATFLRGLHFPPLYSQRYI